MKDIQNMKDERGIAIQRVGISDTHLPLAIISSKGQKRNIDAHIEKFTVNLLPEFKGTHMSRFMEILYEKADKVISYELIDAILTDALERLEAQAAQIAVSFTYFIEKVAPVSKRPSLLNIRCSYYGEKIVGEETKIKGKLVIPVTSLCPCSKEISSYGAHNQRSKVTLTVEPNATSVDIDALVKLVEESASCPIYPALKREDEKYVTEYAYDNPKFVEDMLRDIVLSVRKLPEIKYFTVECENFESIHNHNAYAFYTEKK